MRRVAFAAPFVAIVACKKPVAEPREPDDGEEVPTGEAAVPRSSMPEPPPDAAVPDAPREAIVVGNGCTDRRITPRPNCNPPPPLVCGEHGATCNPPKPVRAHVIRAEVSGNATVLTVDRGTNDGVALDWHACFVDTRDVCRNEGGLRLFKVQERQVHLKSTWTYDQVVAQPNVKLTPP